jgi:hypothetical protein
MANTSLMPSWAIIFGVQVKIFRPEIVMAATFVYVVQHDGAEAGDTGAPPGISPLHSHEHDGEAGDSSACVDPKRHINL